MNIGYFMLPEKEESVYSHRSIDDGHEGEHLDVALTQWHHVLYKQHMNMVIVALTQWHHILYKQHMNRVISMAPHSLQATHEYGNLNGTTFSTNNT